MPDFARLGENSEMWTYLSFEPWEHGAMRGMARKITMVKDSLMGPVAKYYAWDYIVWLHRGEADIDDVFHKWKPLPDVMVQRFLFVGGSSLKRRVKGYWLGFKGFLEIYSYTPGGECHPKVKDLVPPIDLAWNGSKR